MHYNAIVKINGLVDITDINQEDIKRLESREERNIIVEMYDLDTIVRYEDRETIYYDFNRDLNIWVSEYHGIMKIIGFEMKIYENIKDKIKKQIQKNYINNLYYIK